MADRGTLLKALGWGLSLIGQHMIKMGNDSIDFRALSVSNQAISEKPYHSVEHTSI